MVLKVEVERIVFRLVVLEEARSLKHRETGELYEKKLEFMGIGRGDLMYTRRNI